MRQIDAFVDSVYQNIDGNRKEIQELKVEMTSHLIESVHELKAEGKSEQDAIEIAIQRFGGEKEIRSIVSQLFIAQKIFAKWVLYSALAVLVLSTTFFGFIWSGEEKNANENSIVATHIFEILHNKNSITQEMKTEIQSLINGTDQVSKVQIYDVSKIKITSIFDYVKSGKPDYQYQHTVWAPKWLYEFYPYGNGDSEWYVNMETKYIGSMSIILFSGMAVYWTLFTIWAIVNSYHHKRLKVSWILVFALFNVLGYILYYFSGKKRKNSTNV